MTINKNILQSVAKNQKPPRLKKYAGCLNAEKIAEGINLAFQNARRLLKSAQLVFEAQDYASAVSLAILSIEESGKAGYLRGLALTDDEKSLKKCWKDYRTHTKKNVSFGLATVIHPGKMCLEDLRPLFMPNNTIAYQTDDLKQLGFYTDCLGNDGHWHSPCKYYTKQDAEVVLNNASHCCYRDENITVREIELWIECLKPVWMKSMAEMKNGLILWRRKMKEENLVPGDDRFEEFISSGINFGAKK